MSSINPIEHDAVTTQDERSFHGSAYAVTVYGCLQVIEAYLGDNVVGTTLNVFLEDGHKNTNQALGNLLEEWRAQQGIDPSTLSFDAMWLNQESFELRKQTNLQYGTIAPGTKTQMQPLQAADILAYSVLNSPHPFFDEVLSQIAKAVPILLFPVSPENVRRSLDAHIAELRSETEVRNQLARAVGVVGGKVRRQGRGFVVHFDNPSDETHPALVKALLAPVDTKRKENK